MAKRIATTLLIATGLLFLVHFLFGWLNANVDSYFYWAIEEYFRTGTYPYLQPFVYIRPTTISPPLYGMYFLFTHNLHGSEVILHAIQLAELAATSILLYLTLRVHVKKPIAMIISCLFAIYPVNMVYATYVLTETPSQLIVGLWAYLIVRGLAHKSAFPIGAAVLVAAVGTLLKYNLGILVAFAGVLLVPYLRRMKLKYFVLPVLAGIILTGWILINHQMTGVWGLSDTRGTPLYEQFIAQTKILPPETDPAVIRMRSLLPKGTDIAVPYWDIQEKLTRALGYDWHAVDTVLFDVAWASVRTHPVEFILHSIANFANMHSGNTPHWVNIGNMGRTDVTGVYKPYCSKIDSARMCAPIISTPWSIPIWNTYIRTEIALFKEFSPATFYLILLPALLYGLLFGKKWQRLYAVMYLTGVVPVALTIHADPRYIVPFYPIAVLLITSVAVQLKLKVDRLW